MLEFVDSFLNRTTMYRLVLYYLSGLLGLAIIFGFFGILPYSPLALIVSTFIIIGVSLAANAIFARVFEAHANAESVYITALILALIITPPQINPFDYSVLPMLIWAPLLAMASKYILAIGKKHVFNPAALAVAITTFTIGQSASWWAGGNLPLLFFVLIGGILIVRKIRRLDLVLGFFVAAAVVIIATTLSENPFVTLEKAVLHSPIFFFAFVMLTEPLTTPPTQALQIAYGALVGLLFAPAIHVGGIYSTPELALLAGNIFSYCASPKGRYVLKLKEKIQVGSDTQDFVFEGDQKLSFRPGQYFEWTLAHMRPDNRGNRRYFTIASSPTEQDVHLGVRFYDPPSTFKKSLLRMANGDNIVASQLAGDFVLPRDTGKKLVFIAGGIGITPFRSMVQYLLDKKEKRLIAMFYSNKTASEIAYRDVFDRAARELGIKTVHTLTDLKNIPKNWDGATGHVSAAMITKNISDYKERTFYISGPRSMVVACEKVLSGMGIKKNRIKKDFFPGFA
jgi:ferredoxin-NADP reductase/Na+-translocating ferredoxin:NAD+ oxidoreductase RnfD subunit